MINILKNILIKLTSDDILIVEYIPNKCKKCEFNETTSHSHYLIARKNKMEAKDVVILKIAGYDAAPPFAFLPLIFLFFAAGAILRNMNGFAGEKDKRRKRQSATYIPYL